MMYQNVIVTFVVHTITAGLRAKMLLCICAFVDHMFLWIKYKCVEFMKFQIQICSI